MLKSLLAWLGRLFVVKGEAERLVITKTDLENAIALWVVAEREGRTRGRDATDAMTVSAVARDSAEYLWGVLGGDE